MVSWYRMRYTGTGPIFSTQSRKLLSTIIYVPSFSFRENWQGDTGKYRGISENGTWYFICFCLFVGVFCRQLQIWTFWMDLHNWGSFLRRLRVWLSVCVSDCPWPHSHGNVFQGTNMFGFLLEAGIVMGSFINWQFLLHLTKMAIAESTKGR